MKELEKVYSPQTTEDEIYDMWLKTGSFNAEPDANKQPFTIVIPPPNVTGKLHMGHALDETLQDILIRFKRMQGFSALWMPGTDHAGIATQIKVEEELRKNEGLTRYDLGREKFLEKVWEWKELYGDQIINQLKKLGSSCDWRRERFTMDDGCSKAVREVFASLYEKGLIYKGERIINWCPKCTTALSDAEVEYEEQAGHFWHIKYRVKDSDEFVIIATTRPETLLGDSAVAVHPSDERYSHLVGKTLILPLVGREIPVVADEYVEKDFGTGCVKITPCHDPNDFEVAGRHNLEHILILDGNAKIINGGKYNGMDRYDARKTIVADLQEQGLLVKTEEHAHNVGKCYRCGTTVEPITSSQWFVKMAPLVKEAIAVVKDKRVEFIPERFSKIYMNWMENVHDWCISRQLWWGHRIPAFYCEDCGEMTVSREDVTICPKCGSKNMRQENDVLDTWFSSALWPFSTLGWPDKTEELEYFYPTSVLVTGYDIIFFWVARMIFSGMEHMKKEPFKKVFLHGIVRDAQGRKMSKSLGNGIDPLEIISKYGADALRFTLVSGISPGNDTRFSEERVEAMRNFCNKIWNASRFALMNLTLENNDVALPAAEKLAIEDKWILHCLNELVAEVTDNLDKFELGVAAAKLYDFLWDRLCDWYIELIKSRFGTESGDTAQRVLNYVLMNTLKLLHPFMPFITENIYGALPHAEELLITAKWPIYSADFAFPEDKTAMETLMDGIRAIRNRRAEMNVPPSRKAHIIIVAEKTDIFEAGRGFYTRLASAAEVSVTGEKPDADGMVSVVTDAAVYYMPMNDLVDREKELARLEKELAKAQLELAKVEGKLANKAFADRAPEQVVNAEREKAARYSSTIERLNETIKAM